MRDALLIVALVATLVPSPFASAAQDRSSRPCRDCTVLDEAPEKLDWRLTIPSQGEPGSPLVLTGRVLAADGETPAAGVLLYFHHTNGEGVYPPPPGSTGWRRRHGTLRGWLRTDAEGRYELRTLRPGPYPDARIPAHIHLHIREADGSSYRGRDFHFTDDPFLSETARRRAVELVRAGDGWRGEKDVILRP
ncbi:MAG: intradiol ring-cleavage dioxygenase [Acidobacteriota bacterium]